MCAARARCKGTAKNKKQKKWMASGDGAVVQERVVLNQALLTAGGDGLVGRSVGRSGSAVARVVYYDLFWQIKDTDIARDGQVSVVAGVE